MKATITGEYIVSSVLFLFSNKFQVFYKKLSLTILGKLFLFKKNRVLTNALWKKVYSTKTLCGAPLTIR